MDNTNSKKFDKIVADHLKEYEVVAGKHNWDAVKLKMANKKRSVRIRVYSWSVAAAAVILALIFLIKPYNNDLEPAPLSEVTKIRETQPVEPVTIIERPSGVINSNEPEKISEFNKDYRYDNYIVENIVKEKEKKKDREAVREEEEKEREEELEIIVTEKETEDKPVRTIYDQGFGERYVVAELSEKNSTRNKSWEIGASVLSSSVKSQESTPLLYQTAPNTYASADMKALSTIANSVSEAAITTITSPSDTKYSPPISAGISVRKYFNNRFAVESGITYSYLSTERRYSNNNVENLKLHYLGIPLNIVADIWNINEKARVYISLGACAEKGIASKYTKHNNSSGGANVVNKSISGIQWSANAYAGISYDILKMCSIYIEPRFSYYFDNGQPLSIRTEKNFIAGINAGIRFIL